MKVSSQDILQGSNIGFKLSDGRPLFSQLSFSFPKGRHGLIGPDESTLTTFCRILAGDLAPSEGAISHRLKSQLYYGPLDDSDHSSKEANTIADELGLGGPIRALRNVKRGVVESELFDLHSEDWDAEERAQRALMHNGMGHIDLLESFDSLSIDERFRVRLAGVEIRNPELLIWDRPTEHLSGACRLRLMDFLDEFSGALIVSTRDRDVLHSVQSIWNLSHFGLRRYDGNLEAYLLSQQAELAAADEALEKAEQELKYRLREAEEAHERRLIRRDRAQKFADTGLPKVHRGNMKRKSQESMAKANAGAIQKVEEAEEVLQQAKAARQQLEESTLMM